MPMALNQLDASVRLFLFLVGNALLVVWTYKAVAGVQEGRMRFLMSTPLFLLCSGILALFDFENLFEQGLAFPLVLNYLLLCPMKLLAFALNRGCVTKAVSSGSLRAFIVALLFNVHVAFEAEPIDTGKKDDDVNNEAAVLCYAHDDVKFSVIGFRPRELLEELRRTLNRICFKVLITLLACYLHINTKPSFSNDFCSSSICTYMWESSVQDVSYFIILSVVNIRLEDSFERPYLPTSFSDFWSRRWNRVLLTLVKDLCYQPLLQGQWIAPRQYLVRNEVSFQKKMNAILQTIVAYVVVHGALFVVLAHMTHFTSRYLALFLFSPFIVACEVALKVSVRWFTVHLQFARDAP